MNKNWKLEDVWNVTFDNCRSKWGGAMNIEFYENGGIYNDQLCLISNCYSTDQGGALNFAARLTGSRTVWCAI
jgi:hypothetical protein